MYLVDTNVVSELRKARAGGGPHPVFAWAASVPASILFLSAITILELEIGIQRKERQDIAQGAILRSWLETKVVTAFEGRILPVDVVVARRCAILHVPDPRPERDALIAATALVHGLTLVTRNVTDFENLGVKLLNPWD
ncbi:type II toxin-antitoxin system VapC family toxin [Rhizobiales bacterium TNE-4]|nr:type II toxin-antitoxin system VapC family toxin [Rhizobiales bacterium TNE-4]MBV1827296.1 type II toxin-antitoxin system VapC family toxin [Rhizobiales bacterium TNE-4]